MAWQTRMCALVALAAVGACGNTEGAAGFDTRELDLRGFERFRIDQTPSLSPEGCPTPYLVNPAEIRRVAEGEYELTFSIAFESETQYQICLSEKIDPDDCDYAEPVPGTPRRLSESDLDELMALFSSVSVNFAPNACQNFSDDPCNINELQWDDLTTTDRYCEQTKPWIGAGFADEVLRAVTALTQPTLDCESLDLACQGLDEAECEVAGECDPIRGALWEGDTDACFAKPPEFLGCAGCLMGYDAGGCAYRESAPERCYCMASTITIPGWVDVFECLPSPGECGTTPQ